MPIRRRVGRKLLEWSEALLGGTRMRSSGSSESAPPITGPGFIESASAIPTVYACANRKALDMARVPLVIGRVKKGEFKPLPETDEPARLFASVNDTIGPTGFWARAHLLKQLTGELFIHLERMGRSRPQELWLFESDRMIVKKGDTRRPKGYEYVLESGNRMALPVENVFHSMLPNPGNQWRGLSPLASTQVYAWLQWYIGKNNVRLMMNGGMPPGWIKFKNFVEADQREELRLELRRRTQGENAHKIGLLWDDAEFIPGATSAKEGEFPALSAEAREHICASFGVPPLYVMNLAHASYANALQQKELYWLSTLDAELDLLAQDITEGILWKHFGDETLEARFDLEKVPAVQDIRLARAMALQGLVAGGLYTQNEAREELGKPKVTGGDSLFIPQVLAPSGFVVPPRSGKADPSRGTKAWIDDPDRHAKRQEQFQGIEAFVPVLERLFIDLADRQEARALAALEKAGPARGKEDEPGDFLDIEFLLEETKAILLRAFADLVARRGQAALDEVVDGDFFDLTVLGVAEWIETVAGEQSKLIVDTLQEQFRQVLAESNAASETQQELATRISEMFDVRRSEALRIAWTEAGKAYNYGTLEGFRQSGVVTQKEWLSAGDDLVRDAHRDADGQKVDLEAFFLVDGELLEFPGAPGGTAANVINCRCAMQPVIDTEAKAARRHKVKVALVGTKDLDEVFAA